MFSFEGFMRINLFLRGIYRIAYLNLLWIAATVAGLVVFGIGPASYAVAAYIDRWFRFGETPPVTRAFVGHLRTHYWRSAAMGWIVSAAAAIAITNIFLATDWILQFANVLALIAVGIVAAYVFPLMAATDVRGLGRQLGTALMIGIGSLHWTIVATAAVAATFWLLANYALPLLFLFGIGIPAAAVGFVTRIVFGRLVADAAAEELHTSPPRARETTRVHAHLARGKSQ
ncbi:YesL family protein [Microbacterium sp. NPDC056234]|uniref:YesL family protein n=1 Tax=Microbacterium sp. NPDC056234 TaxID=3345757 RepID=UPI0035E0CFEF